MSPLLLVAAGLLVGSATFSGAEAALFTLAGQRGGKRPQVARRLLDDRSGALAVILLCNLGVNLSFFAAAQTWAAGLDATAQAAAGLGAVGAIVVFGEILPKLLAYRFPAGVGRVLLPPVWLGHLLLAPALRPLGRAVQPGADAMPLDSDQTRAVLRREAALEGDEQVLIGQLLELGRLRAGALRAPLADLVRVRASAPLAEAVDALLVAGAVAGAVVDDAGDVVGILDRSRGLEGDTAAAAMRVVPIVPEVAPVANGVRLLRDSGAPFVLLVDEYGEAAGIIRRGRWADALLDRLPARHGNAAPPLELLVDGTWLVDAALPLHVLEERLGVEAESDVRVDTIGGLVAERLGRLPEPGDIVVLPQDGARCTLTVLRAHETRPLQLALRLDAERDDDREEEA